MCGQACLARSCEAGPGSSHLVFHRATRVVASRAALAVAALVILTTIPLGELALTPGPIGSNPLGRSDVGSAASARAGLHPLGLGGHIARPLAGSELVHPEGATITQFDGSSAISGVASLSMQVKLVRSPYGIGYELNGLSDSGDWYPGRRRLQLARVQFRVRGSHRGLEQ